MKQLIINGELAFIDKDQYFPFTYKISDLEEINIINFPSTKSIMLPRNTQNDEIFGHIAEITRNNYGFSDNQSGVSFNQIKKANYELKNNSEIVSEGIVRIVNITHSHYEVELYDKAIEVLEELEDKEINDLEIINPVTGKPLEERINHETIKDMTVRDWGITPVFVDYDSNFTGNKIYARYNTITGIGEKEIEFPREMTPFQMRTFSAANIPFTMHLTKMMDMIEAKQEVRFSEAVREQLAYVHMLLKKPKNGLSSTEYKLRADHKYLNRAEREYPVWHNYHVWTDDNQWYIVHNGNHLMKNDLKILFTTNNSQLNGNVWSNYKGKTYDDNTKDGTLIGMLNIKSQITLIHNDGAGTEYIKEVNTKVPMYKNRNVSYLNAGPWSYLTVKGTFILNNDIYPKDKRGITMRANHSITNVVDKETTYPFDYTFDYSINSEILGTMIHKPLEFTEYDLLTSKKILPNITIKDFIINIAKTFNYNIKAVDGKLLIDIKRYNLANEGLLIDDNVEIDVNKVDFSRLKITSKNASSPLIEEYEEEYETWASKIVNTGYSIKKEEKEVELPYGTPLALTDYNYFAFDQYGAYLNGGYSKYPVGCIKGLEDELTLGYLGINEETMYVSDAEIIENTSVISNRRLYRIAEDGIVEWKFDNDIDVPVSILPKYATFLPYRFSEGNILESLEVNKPHYNFASVKDSQYPEDATLYNRFHKNMLEDKFNSNTHILNAKVFLFGEQDINKVYNYKNSQYIISELVEYDPTEPNMYEVKLMRVNQDLNYTLKPYNPLPEDPNQGIVIVGIKPYDMIQVSEGTEESALPIPSEALAYMSDGSEQIFDVAWDRWENDFNGNLFGEYIRYGNVISEEYDGSVSIVVKVGDYIYITGDVVETKSYPYNTDVNIPTKSTVTLNDGTTRTLDVVFEDSVPPFNKLVAGDYVFTGRFILDEDILNTYNYKHIMNVTIQEDTRLTIVSSNLYSTSITYGTRLNREITTYPLLSDGTRKPLLVRLYESTPPFNNTVSGDYYFDGVFQLPDHIINPNNVVQEVKVFVTEPKVITSVASISDISTVQGIEAELPLFIMAYTNGGYGFNAEVNWEPVGVYNNDIPGTYTFTGDFVLPEGVINPDNLKASVNVIVTEIPVHGYWVHKDTGVKTDFGLDDPSIVDGIMNSPSWYRDCSEVQIPSGVTGLGDECFYWNMSLISIILPEGITSLGESCFERCYYLSSITLPVGITSIGKNCFNNCQHLTSIILPEGVTSIGQGCFSQCFTLTSVNIPESVTRLPYGCFTDCYALTSIDIPESVTYIGGSCFQSCTSLTSATIPDGVTNLGSWSFAYCDSLTSVNIPQSVTIIESYCFEMCYYLSSITLPESLISLGIFCFRGCSALTSIIIPDGVTRIGQNCFQDCSSLTLATVLPTTPPTLGTNVFIDAHISFNIKVPDETVDAYKIAAGWNAYADKISAIRS